MVINVRGTSGSGKTTVVRGVFKAGTAEKLFATEDDGSLFGKQSPKPEAYRVDVDGVARPVFVIGSYEQVCGGCDSIGTQDEVCDRVRRYAAKGHVLLEGLLISHLFSRYAALDRELQPTRYVWAFLDTPLELCLARVEQRRLERGVTKPLNPTNTTQKWHDAHRVFAKCQAAGLDARWVDHQTATADVLAWLLGGQ
ncbi:MAG TPA: hypothetical protein DCP69_01700 [Candidatus Omnitrophica bacterium]|nr:hypothetical protein [Candidatus Omnitrophota bacterium]